MAGKKTARAVHPPFGPWDYYAGSVYDLGLHDFVAAGVTTYAQAEAHPEIRVQPSVICQMPEIGPFAAERHGRLIASLPDLVARNGALEDENRKLRERLRVLEANARNSAGLDGKSRSADRHGSFNIRHRSDPAHPQGRSQGEST